MLKSIITGILESYARRLLKKHKPKIVAVVGSLGKTSTKLAIATVLSQKYRVLAHYSSYNTPIGLPMAIFNLVIPEKVKSASEWLNVFKAMRKQLREDYPYDVLVLELGADKPGDIAYFKKYIQPDIAVVTAVAPEHMANFKTIDAVAAEELAITHFAKASLINRDNIDGVFSKLVPDGTAIDTYGTSGIAEYRFTIEDFKPGIGFKGLFVSPELGQLPVALKVVGEHNVRPTIAAGAVGVKLGLNAKQLVDGLQAIVPVKGRMNLLRGLEGTTLIDDTYNASPPSMIAALQTLYLFPTTQRIAILGSMNELGDFSPQAHQSVGEVCDTTLLDWVITVGAEAEKYLAPAAKKKGCQVRSFMSPYDAGAFAHSVLQRGAVVLAKGSQNGVFTEEALKELLHSTEEEKQLVRQSADWLAKKQAQFEKFN
jgi:UDP-N-acetylmuramoyl-tripeptide--D-alanyl-D-alanine ligase